MRLRGMIFDMDGTLCDTLNLCIAAFQRVFADYLGRRYGAEEILGMFGPSEEGIIQQMIPVGYEPAVADFLAEYECLHNGRTIAFPGIERALEMLRARGITLGVVTGKGAGTAAISFRHLGLEHYFDVVQAGSPEGGVKPESIRKVLARWGMAPGEVAYLGDSPSDMADAIEVGVLPLAAGWAATSAVQDPDCCGAVVTFHSVEGFCEWIERET
jgi:phosphoglycolate phosphatase-like HAD superfamily hydrolase